MTLRDFGRPFGRAVVTMALVGAGLVAAAPAQADSCREWRVEHEHWKSEAVRRYLDGSPEKALDTAVFELLQREAYLTSCDLPVNRARDRFVGWRLVGHSADDYGRVVVQSLLEEAGMTLDVRSWFGPMLSMSPSYATAEGSEVDRTRP